VKPRKRSKITVGAKKRVGKRRKTVVAKKSSNERHKNTKAKKRSIESRTRVPSLKGAEARVQVEHIVPLQMGFGGNVEVGSLAGLPSIDWYTNDQSARQVAARAAELLAAPGAAGEQKNSVRRFLRMWRDSLIILTQKLSGLPAR